MWCWSHFVQKVADVIEVGGIAASYKDKYFCDSVAVLYAACPPQIEGNGAQDDQEEQSIFNSNPVVFPIIIASRTKMDGHKWSDRKQFFKDMGLTDLFIDNKPCQEEIMVCFWNFAFFPSHSDIVHKTDEEFGWKQDCPLLQHFFDNRLLDSDFAMCLQAICQSFCAIYWGLYSSTCWSLSWPENNWFLLL